MKNVLWFILLSFSLQAHAGKWLTINPGELKRVEIFQKDFSSSIIGGVYFMHKTNFTSDETCTKKQFIAVTDSKLSDQALSVGLFAIASDKSIMLWIDGCSNSYLHATAVSILP